MKYLWIAVAFGLISAFLLHQSLSQVRSSYRQVPQGVPVVIASRPVQARVEISPNDLEMLFIPEGLRIHGAFHDPEEVLGQYALVDLEPGEQMTRSKVASGPDAGLSALIPPSSQVLTLPIDPWDAMAGLLQPGDLVDIFGLYQQGGRGRIQTIAQEVLVLAVDRELRGQQGMVPDRVGQTTVSLALPPDLVAQVALVGEYHRLRLALSGDIPSFEGVLGTEDVLAYEDEPGVWVYRGTQESYEPIPRR